MGIKKTICIFLSFLILELKVLTVNFLVHGLVFAHGCFYFNE